MTRETLFKARELCYEIEQIQEAIQDSIRWNIVSVKRMISEEEAIEIQNMVANAIQEKLGSKLNKLEAELAAL